MQDFDFYSDPGHGWLKVPAAKLEAVGLTARDFTSYSYASDTALYLEEDADASKFIDAWRAKFGEPSIKEHTSKGRSFIRSLRPNGEGEWHPFAERDNGAVGFSDCAE